MSQSPEKSGVQAEQYFDNWNALATRIRNRQSFSGRERNCCFLNTSEGRFADISSAIGLDLIDDGRGLAFVDWDQDGDIDIWTANRTGPQIRFMQNNSSTNRNSVSFRLQGTKCNRDAIGARVSIRFDDPSIPPMIKTLRAGEGFLSQSSKTMHFGLGENVKIKEVSVRWPGEKDAQRVSPVQSGKRYLIKQEESVAIELAQRDALQLDTQALPVSMPNGLGRTLLTQRRELGRFKMQSMTEEAKEVVIAPGTPRFINLWASWCQPCIEELNSFQEQLQRSGNRSIHLVAASVDEVDDAGDMEAARSLSRSWLNIETCVASSDLLRRLTDLHNDVIYRQRSLPLPTSFLVDQQGQVAAIYKGPMTWEQLCQDIDLLDLDSRAIAKAAAPFEGRSITGWFSAHPVDIAKAYLEGDYVADAKRELTNHLTTPQELAPRKMETLQLLKRIAAYEKNDVELVAVLRSLAQLEPKEFSHRIELVRHFLQSNQQKEAKRLIPTIPPASVSNASQLVNLGQLAMQLGMLETGLRYYETATRVKSNDSEILFGYALALQVNGDIKGAITQYQNVLASDSEMHDAANNLSWLLANAEDSALRDTTASIELAKRICKATEYKKLSYLDTLVTAYLSANQRGDAVKTLEMAIERAAMIGDQQSQMRFKRELATLSQEE